MSGVLLIQTAFLGDVVLTTPLISAAAERFRSLPVSVLVIPPGAQALGYPASPIPGIQEIIVYDKRGRHRGLIEFFRLARRLKYRRFDVALVPHRSHRSAVLAYLAGVPIRVGFRQNALGPLFTHRVDRAMDKHEALRNLALLEPFGGPPAGFVPKLNVAVTDESRGAAKLLLKDIPEDTLRVGIAPGSVWGTKRWLPGGFAAVMDNFPTGWRGTGPATFIILGGPDDIEAAQKVAQITHASFINLAGKTTIPEMIAVIESLDLFITNDTGPMHIAAALDVPIVAVFGATTPALGFAPFSRDARIVEPPTALTCRPCSAHGPQSCPEGHFRCMREITPQMVLDAICDLQC